MTNREIRKLIFGDMLRQPQPKEWRAVKAVWKVAWLEEERGLTKLQAQKKAGYRSADYPRQILALYKLRKQFLLKGLY